MKNKNDLITIDFDYAELSLILNALKDELIRELQDEQEFIMIKDVSALYCKIKEKIFEKELERRKS